MPFIYTSTTCFLLHLLCCPFPSPDLSAVWKGRWVEAHLWGISDCCQLGHDCCSLHQVRAAEEHIHTKTQPPMATSTSHIHTSSVKCAVLILHHDYFPNSGPWTLLNPQRNEDWTRHELQRFLTQMSHSKKVHSRSCGPLPSSNPHLATTFNHQFELIKSCNCALNLLSGLAWASTVCSLPQQPALLQGVCGQIQPDWGRGWLQGLPAWEDCCPWEMEPHLCGLRVRQAPPYRTKSSRLPWYTVHHNPICSASRGKVGRGSNSIYSLRSIFKHLIFLHGQ